MVKTLEEKKALKEKTDEELIQLFKLSRRNEFKNELFKLLIERCYDHEGIIKTSWKSKVTAAVRGFIKRAPFVEIHYDENLLKNKIYENLYKSLNNYNTSRQFSTYFNGLIYKTLMNVKRNFLVKSKHYVYDTDNKDGKVVFVQDERIDDLIGDDGDLNKHEAISSGEDLEKDVEKKELLALVWKKCRKYLSDSAIDILISNDLTNNMTNGDLAKKYKCSAAKISSIKTRQIVPAINRIRKEIQKETGIKHIIW